jgi:hypothetical protein
MTELMKTIAVVFKRKGKSMLSEKEFVNTLLFDLRWSDTGKSPKITAVDAQKILDAGIKQGLLSLQEGVLKPVFDYKVVEIPLNFLPSKEVMDELRAAAIQSEGSAQSDIVKAAPMTEVGPVKETKVTSVDVPLFTVLIEDIAQRTGMKKKDIVAQINRLQEKLMVVPEVAALIVAREKGMDISKYYSITKEEIKRK